ncbi:single-stranded DNA-binding protein [Actinokineospora enzanensis]|uniref:single-stranded DNA-binding protein n=1 Tax=Actinokineospora enzanensis TaxID=155975 RepID=UPI0003825C4F|nr:single-stranded DNA-binding protein [Actinokineospora enzanensis]
MNETMVTLAGRVVSEITKRRCPDERDLTQFRLYVKERRYDPDTGSWRDGDSLFIGVRCWGRLGEHVDTSVRRGDRVIVFGRLYHREYRSDAVQRIDPQVEARAVGIDLGYAPVTVTRTAWTPANDEPEQTKAA